jgi:hypothetical protein
VAVPTFRWMSVTERSPALNIPYTRDPDRDGKGNPTNSEAFMRVKYSTGPAVDQYRGSQSVVSGRFG